MTVGLAPGTVLTDERPRGYAVLRRSADVGAADDFERLTARLFARQVQRVSGIRVTALGGSDDDAPAVTAGLGARLRIPVLALGALRIEVAAPVRVSAVVREPDRVGFAYRTLAGHPEHGEEAWLLERADGRVTLTIRALSRPAFPYSLVPWVGRSFQRRFTQRYLSALRS